MVVRIDQLTVSRCHRCQRFEPNRINTERVARRSHCFHPPVSTLDACHLPYFDAARRVLSDAENNLRLKACQFTVQLVILQRPPLWMIVIHPFNTAQVGLLVD